MELNIGIFLHRHLQGIGRLGQKHVPTLFVLSQIQGLAHLEVGELCFVGAGNPCGLVERNRFITARGIVLVQQAVLDDFKLQLTYRADDLATRHFARKELSHTFVGKLFQALSQLLRLHRVSIFHIAELLG